MRPVLATLLLAAACSHPHRAPVIAIGNHDLAPVVVHTDAQALALLADIAPTGADWEDRVLDLPDGTQRAVAAALLRAGRFECTAIHEEEVGCGEIERSFAPLAPAATLDDPCLRRALAGWALDQLDAEDLPGVDDALATLVALPKPETELGEHVFSILDDHDDDRRLRLIAAAVAAGRDDVADDAVTGLTPAGAARALVDQHRAAALHHLGDAPAPGVVAAALGHGLSHDDATDAIGMLREDDLKDPAVAAAIRQVAATADCDVAALATQMLIDTGDAGAAPSRATLGDETTAVRALCVARAMSEDELGRVLAPMMPNGGVPIDRVERVSYVDPTAPDDNADGDHDPHTTAEHETLTAADLGADASDWMPTACDGRSCQIGSDTADYHFVHARGGRLTLDQIDLEHSESDGCGC